MCPVVLGFFTLFMFSKFTHTVAYITTLFLSMAEYCPDILNHILFICSFVDGYLGFSTFWLLWILLLGKFAYKCLFEFLFSTCWMFYLRVEFLSHVVIICLSFWGTNIFTEPAHLHSHHQYVRILISPQPHQYSLFFFLRIVTIDTLHL